MIHENDMGMGLGTVEMGWEDMIEKRGQHLEVGIQIDSKLCGVDDWAI